MDQIIDHKAKYNHLKRKLEDLEEVHKEGKQTHAIETEQLRTELARVRKVNKEQTEQIARLKKHNELTEAHAQDLKRELQTAQSEAREVRVRLRNAEIERDRLASKQTTAVETRRAAVAAESRARTNIQEREKRIEELQNSVSEEKRRALEAERRCDELKSKMEKERRDTRLKLMPLERELQRVKTRLADAESHNASLERDSSSTVESLEEQISQYKALHEVIAKEYGRLASTTTSLEAYDNMKTEASRLRICVARLERKSANSDEQVTELAHLIRQSQITNSFLSEQLRSAYEELEWRTKEMDFASGFTFVPITDDTLNKDVEKALDEERCSYEKDREEIDSLNRTQIKHYSVLNSQLIEHLSGLERLLDSEKEEVARIKAKLSESDLTITKLSAENVSHKNVSEGLKRKISEQNTEIYNLRTKLTESEKAVATAEASVRAEIQKREDLLRKERELTTRMQATVQKGKMAEEALKAEIDQLTGELANAEDYCEAYMSLAEEMRGLVARNALAEDEATRLSEFNAEILSHRNPTQKILYVDRIRRELAETKQKLALSSRDYDTAQAEATSLREELAMYKSVAVPFASKPRTHLTRVRRLPLGTASSQKLNVTHSRPGTGPVSKDSNYGCEEENGGNEYEHEEEDEEGYAQSRYRTYGGHGDMTIDELS